MESREENRDPTRGRQAPSPPPAAEAAARTCSNCGATLTERRCKLTCPRPGCPYYLSCADLT